MEETRIQELTNEILENKQEELEIVVPKRRARSMTTLKLEWLAERVRKCKKIKSEVEAGTYNVDSKKVAKSILNLDMIEEDSK